MPPRGFTLIELMVALAVVAVLATIAYPSFTQVIRSNRVATAANELVASVALARHTAIRNTHGAGLCASANGTSCGSNWSRGFLIWEDIDGDSTLDGGELVLRFVQGPAQMQLTGTANRFAFDRRGRLKNATNVTFGLQPSECGGQELRRTFVINASGQMRTTRGACL